MRDVDEKSITEAVLERFADTPDPRLRTIMSSLIRHLHDFVRDVEPSFEEWNGAVDFLTRTGQMCDEKRQEFILLSDTLGVSMLVDAINHRLPDGATETTVLGPFYVENPKELDNGDDIAVGEGGVKLLVEGRVRSVAGAPVANAIVDVWHSDDDGFYDVQNPEFSGMRLRGRLRTDADGRFHFWSIMPRWYPIPDDGPVGQMLYATKRHPNRPAHIHFLIQADGYETLVTHLFSEDSPYLDSDAVFGVKSSLIRHFAHEPAGMIVRGKRMTEEWRRLDHEFGLKLA